MGVTTTPFFNFSVIDIYDISWFICAILRITFIFERCGDTYQNERNIQKETGAFISLKNWKNNGKKEIGSAK